MGKVARLLQLVLPLRRERDRGPSSRDERGKVTVFDATTPPDSNLSHFSGNLTGTKLSSQRWPDVLSSHEGDWLWSHEWDKHGTCAKPVLNGEHEYFAKALELYDILNPTEVFAQNGMIPSNTRTYDRDQVISVLTKSFGDTFVIGCQESGKDLFQIEFCLQKDFQGRNCGKSANSNCSSNQDPKLSNPC